MMMLVMDDVMVVVVAMVVTRMVFPTLLVRIAYCGPCFAQMITFDSHRDLLAL